MKLWRFVVIALIICFGAGCANQEDLSEAEVTKTDEEIRGETIQEFICSMDTEEKIGQLLMADFRNNEDGSGMTVLTEDVARKVRDYHLGGVILFAENIDTLEQAQKLVDDFQNAAEIPLLVGIDEEGGLVSRLDKSNIAHTSMPSAGEMDQDYEAKEAGRSIGETLLSMGVNVDFAPVADINTNPENPVIGIRSYSDDPEKTAEMVCAFIQGLQATGVSATVKHFPGHGDTQTDSHYGEVFVTHDLDRLRTVEFVPFAKAIDEGVDLVMIGHIQTPSATSDGLPASLSAEAVQLLRNELNFQGVAITDAMNMQAITQYYGVGESSVLSVLAGVDIVLMPADLDVAYEALLEALEQGRITQTRLDESLERILGLKYDKGLLK